MTDRRVRIGGLMRCCTETIYERADSPEDTPGMVVLCKHCTHGGLRLTDDDVWEWNRA